jgi:hypothetical protein
MDAWSTPDLSDVTQVLRGLIETAVNHSSLSVGNIQVLCDSPDTARQSDGHCHLNIYLLHVGRDPFWRNTPVQGPRPQLNSAQPLSLNLSYLLTAWCDKDFTSEQRAMSIALQAIHSNPIVTHDLIVSDLLTHWLPKGEFVMSIEADTIEEMSRLWQAFTVPMRLSALIKVGVIFVKPLEPVSTPAIPPSTANLDVSLMAKDLPGIIPQLTGGLGAQVPPLPPGAGLSDVSPVIGPLVVVGDGSVTYLGNGASGGTVAIAGVGLDLPAAVEVFLSVPGTATEWDVTHPWRQNKASDELYLALPGNYADPAVTPPPAATPLPGLYSVAVGVGVGPGSFRSNAIPLAIAPRIDGVTSPPILSANAAGLYVMTGAGFVASSATTVSLGGSGLAYTGTATPGHGEFTVDSAGTQITFLPPTAIPSGAYPVLLAVNGVAATTGWVVTL